MAFADAGAGGFNNPTQVAIQEALDQFTVRGQRPTIGCIVSVGTGLQDVLSCYEDPRPERLQSKYNMLGRVLETGKENLQTVKRTKELMEYFVKIATDTDRVHQTCSHTYQDDNIYYRFDTPNLGAEDLAELRTVYIRAQTNEYLRDVGVRRQIQACAERLNVG